MLISSSLHKKGSEVFIKTRSTPASRSYKGQATQHTTVKWSIRGTNCHNKNFPLRLVLKERLRRTRKRSITTLSSWTLVTPCKAQIGLIFYAAALVNSVYIGIIAIVRTDHFFLKCILQFCFVLFRPFFSFSFCSIVILFHLVYAISIFL